MKKFQLLEDIKYRLLNSNETMNAQQLKIVNKVILKTKKNIEKNQEYLMELGRLIDYDFLKKNGKSKEVISTYFNKDCETIEDAKRKFKKHVEDDHLYMFGYPSNMGKDSYVISYLRWLESQMYFTNSCGNAYNLSNYRMNNADAELKLIDLVKSNLNLPKDLYWGYVTTGGTESNLWGIREGLSKYPNGVVYFSDAAHYSVQKMNEIFKCDDFIKIKSSLGKIVVEELFEYITKNYNIYSKPAILLLTYGTTAFGSTDDVEYIKNRLVELKIPHYIHLDAALYGGIPKNQINSPICALLDNNNLNIDSVSISLHKYIGNPKANGVLLAKTQLNKRFIDYIGQDDLTISGSRDFPPFSTIQRVEEMYERSKETDYSSNINIFEQMLMEEKIPYIKGNKFGNIFVIDKPSNKICKKYQLSTFKYNDKKYSHIIVFQYHKKEIMKELIMELTGKNKKISTK